MFATCRTRSSPQSGLMTPISLLSTASDVSSVPRISCCSLCFKSRKLSGRHPGVRAGARRRHTCRRRRRRGCRCKSECVLRLLHMLYSTCTLQYRMCRYRPRAGVPAAGTGIRIRRAGRGVATAGDPCGISVAIISAKSDTTVKPHAIYHNARRVTRLPSTLAAWLRRRSMLPLRPQFLRPQMRSFDVILHPANEAPSSKPIWAAGAGTGTFYPSPQCTGTSTAERIEHRKRATLISSGGRAHCTPPLLLRTGPGNFSIEASHSLARGPSSLDLLRSSKAVRLLLWGHPSATTTTTTTTTGRTTST